MGDGVLRKSRRDTADARNGTCDTVVTGWKIIRKKGRIELTYIRFTLHRFNN